jgi:hypothetical protein
VLHALADGEDVLSRGLHVVVHDHAAVHEQLGLVREVDVRADTGGDDDEIGFEHAVVGERHAFHVPVAQDRRRCASEQDADAQILHLAEQVLAAVRIELPLHQRGHQVHDGHVAPLHLQSPRGLEPEQAAADHDRLLALARALEQAARVVERAEDEHAVLVEPLDRRHEGAAAGGEQQHVVRRDAAVVAGHVLRVAVHVHDADAEAQVDVVFLIPVEPVDDDVVGRLLAGEHRREHDAVVVDVGLVAEDRHREARLVLEDLLEAVHPGHAVADDDQPLHTRPPSTKRSTRTADCL